MVKYEALCRKGTTRHGDRGPLVNRADLDILKENRDKEIYTCRLGNIKVI